jgi:hypothetical protein
MWQVKDYNKDDPIVPLNPVKLKNENYEISGSSGPVKYYLPRPLPKLDSNEAEYVTLAPGQNPYPTFHEVCGGFTYTLLTNISKVGSLVVSTTTDYPVLQI